MNETQRRFLRDIADRIPLERLAELHLFPPLRQGGVETGVAVVAAVPDTDGDRTMRSRHVVFSARYRLTRKGAERGKWETEIVAEADAPLMTVDAVVRGVQRRAGELATPERLTMENVRAILDDASWPVSTT